MSATTAAHPSPSIRAFARRGAGAFTLELRKLRRGRFWPLFWTALGLETLWLLAAEGKRAVGPVATRQLGLGLNEVLSMAVLFVPILAAVLASRLVTLDAEERMGQTWSAYGQRPGARFRGKLLVAGLACAAGQLGVLAALTVLGPAVGLRATPHFWAALPAAAVVLVAASFAVSAAQIALAWVCARQAVGLGGGGGRRPAVLRPGPGGGGGARLGAALGPGGSGEPGRPDRAAERGRRPGAHPGDDGAGRRRRGGRRAVVRGGRGRDSSEGAERMIMQEIGTPISGGARRRPSLAAAWAWENRKNRAWWFWAAWLLLGGLGMLQGWSQYASYRSEFVGQGTTWSAVWGQATLLTSMVFLPLALAALAAQQAAGERAGRNWQRFAAGGMAGTLLAGKLLHAAQVAVIATALFFGEFVLTGLALGFDPRGLAPYLARAALVAFAAWTILCLMHLIGLYTGSFAATMTVAVVLVVAGGALTLVAPALAGFFPSSLLTAAFSSRQLAADGPTGSPMLTAAVCVVWAVVLIGWMRYRIGRQG